MTLLCFVQNMKKILETRVSARWLSVQPGDLNMEVVLSWVEVSNSKLSSWKSFIFAIRRFMTLFQNIVLSFDVEIGCCFVWS